ncbi:MAG: GDP-mannose 4,6-dehydratase [Mariniphaga sp.]
MNILITGGAGFIGSNLTDALLKQKHNVVCLDNFDNFYDPAIKRLNIRQALNSPNYFLVEGDIRDSAVLGKIFREHQIDIVVHLAAKAGVRPSLMNPGLYYDVNLLGTLSVLEAMKKHNGYKMIMASSSSVYGNNDKVPFSENDSVDHPVSPYAASKKAAELLCYTYSHLYGFDIFCMRFFTVYGPRQRPEMAIHQFVRKILKGETIQLYGDGFSQRDYTYVSDIVQGLVNVLDRLKGYEIINLGESQPIALRDLIKSIESIVDRKAVIEWNPGQPGDTEITFADISKAQRLLNYKPEFLLKDGLKNFVEWFMDNN